MPTQTTASQTTTRPGICRICSAHCGVLATVTDGKLTKVTGDPDNPMFKGYTCAKGRALPEIHNNPHRLLHSQQRQTDGSYAPIEAERAMDEIAAQLQQLIDTHGPRSVRRRDPEQDMLAGRCLRETHVGEFIVDDISATRVAGSPGGINVEAAVLD